MTKCDCGATSEGKWSDKHTIGCASLYEPYCFDLAERFIETAYIGADHQERCKALADIIHSVIIGWMGANPPKRP